MSIITSAYFKNEISIPQQADGIKSVLADYISICENKYLNLALGYSLYTEFIAGLAETTPEQKWLNLRDGAEYNVTENGKTHVIKWRGLKNTEMISLLAYFTYFDFVHENFDSAGLGSAMFVNTAENSLNVSPRTKLVSVFNKGLDLFGSVPMYYYGISEEVGTMITTREQLNFSTYWYLEPSLFNFIYFANLAVPNTYENWIFTGLNRKNLMF